MPLFLRYHSSIFFLSIILAVIALLILKLPLLSVLAILFIPQIFSHIIQFTSIRKLQKDQTFQIFGLTKSAIRKERILTLLAGIALLIFIYFTKKLKWDGGDTNKTWLFTTLIGFKMLESFIPFSNWNVIVHKDLVYIKKPFIVGDFKLDSRCVIRKIATDKIELQQNEGSIELQILDEEMEKFQHTIHNLKTEIN